jgi:hypothetical protein
MVARERGGRQLSAKVKGLADAFRQTGRHFLAGKPMDIDVLSAIVEEQRAQLPRMSAKLTDLLHAIQDEAGRGDRPAALKHFRVAIELADESEKRQRAEAKGK